MNTNKLLQMMVLWLAVFLLAACGAQAGAPASGPTTATPILLPPTVSGPAATPAAAEEDAWQKVQCADAQSLQTFLAAFPAGAEAGDANLYLALNRRMDEIRTKREKPALIIPFEKLGERWQDWKQRLPDKGGIGYFVTQDSMGIFSLPGCQTISMDAYGMPMTPTGDGSIAAFRTGGSKFEYLNSIVIQSAEGDILHFGVIDDIGLVYLRGRGSVFMPDGTQIQLPGSHE
jgi:hypothetical protein